MRHVVFQEDSLEHLNYWGAYDKKVFKKIMELIKNIDRTPFKGLGKPEPLKHRKDGIWSRRINQEHRLLYKISSN